VTYDATTVPRGNNLLSRILIAIDDSEHSARALRYVGTLLREARDVRVTLFHVLKPMPRELLKHGGSEDPAAEVRLSEELRQDQENSVRTENVWSTRFCYTRWSCFGKQAFLWIVSP